MAIRKILQLGNPALHEVASEVETDELEPTRLVAADLHDTIEIFAKNNLQKSCRVAASANRRRLQ